MNKKLIIQIVLIVVGFSGSGYVLYNGFFKNSAPAVSVAPEVVGEPGQAVEKVLPYGDKLDFKGVLDQQNLQYNVITYPVVATATEVGIVEQGLVQSLKSGK